MKSLAKQFERPEGVLGRLAGWLMGRSNQEINRWTLSLLDIQPADRILEVGFGPGLAIQLLAEMATNGFIAGVDLSEPMLRKATTLNRKAIAAGRVELRLGSVLELPYQDNAFDKAVSVDAIQLWTDQDQAFRELRRVVREDGLIAATLQPRWAKSERELMEVTSGLVSQFKRAGLAEVMLYRKSAKPVPAFCAVGRNCPAVES